MGDRLVEQRRAIDLYLYKNNKRSLELSDDEWCLLAKVVKLLGSLKSASKQMCLDVSPISVQFPIARMLSRTLYDVDDPLLQSIRASLLGLLVEKFDVEGEK